MMHHAPFISGRVDPDPLRLEDEEVVGVDKARVGNPALDIGEAIANQRAFTSLAERGFSPKR